MAVLDENSRKTLWAKFMSDASNSRDSLPLLKADLRAAVDAIDDWIETNKTAFNSAIPQPSRSSLTAKQKAKLLMIVVAERFKVS